MKTIALVGNPNSGKTTLFNRLTGSNQVVGNWPGVTVERKEGYFRLDGKEYCLVDLPGVYSLSPYSAEESVACDFLTGQPPDLIINLVDVTVLERSLYLTLQLRELEIPMIVLLNMADAFEKMGGKISPDLLSRQLGVPVLLIAARQGAGVDQLYRLLSSGFPSPPRGLLYHAPTREACRRIVQVLKIWGHDVSPFLCCRVLEGTHLPANPTCREEIGKIIGEYCRQMGQEDSRLALTQARYQTIEAIGKGAVVTPLPEAELTYSDQLDRLITGKWTGFPIFAAILFSLFAFTFSGFGEQMRSGLGWVTNVFLGNAFKALLWKTHAPGWCWGFLLDGVLGGVGAVFAFLPQILLLFFFLALLEDSGYMARAAFLMDWPMSAFGLSGRAFIPMMTGFGCTTPAVLACRTMENQWEQRLTILLLPFISCGAKLPIYLLIAGTFFAPYSRVIVTLCYLLGILLAIVTGLVLRRVFVPVNQSAFLMELPPYRLPSPINVLGRMWSKCVEFCTRAGTVILAMSVLVWLLQHLTFQLHWTEGEASIFEHLGRGLAPLLSPLGFGTWQAAVALLTGLAAKETVVSTMAVLYGAGSMEALQEILRGIFTPAAGLSFLVFSLLYPPCIASQVTMSRELRSRKWMIFSILLQLAMAYGAAWLTYHIGGLILG